MAVYNKKISFFVVAKGPDEKLSPEIEVIFGTATIWFIVQHDVRAKAWFLYSIFYHFRRE